MWNPRDETAWTDWRNLSQSGCHCCCTVVAVPVVFMTFDLGSSRSKGKWPWADLDVLSCWFCVIIPQWNLGSTRRTSPIDLSQGGKRETYRQNVKRERVVLKYQYYFTDLLVYFPRLGTPSPFCRRFEFALRSGEEQYISFCFWYVFAGANRQAGFSLWCPIGWFNTMTTGKWRQAVNWVQSQLSSAHWSSLFPEENDSSLPRPTCNLWLSLVWQ